MLQVIVTRPAGQAAPLTEALQSRGITATACPTIEIAPPLDYAPVDSAIERLATFDWVVFTSANAVDAFFDRAGILKASEFIAKVGVIGPATRAALESRDVTVNLEAGTPVAESLAQAFTSLVKLEGMRFLLPRAAEARDMLPLALANAGASVESVAVYRNVLPEQNRELLIGLLESPSIVVCTSSSTARNLVELAGLERARAARVIAVGPITAQSARSFGLAVIEELAAYDTGQIVEAVERAIQEKS